MRISARNKLCGTIKAIGRGPVNAKVVIQLSEPATVTAIVTDEAVDELGLSEGEHACAVVKATDVLLGLCQEAKAGCKQ
jgi:molybdate transport system regulatory protein